MSRADNSRYLAEAAAARHRDAHRRASDAIERPDRQGAPITFASVAAAAFVSRAWLYRQDDLREIIIRLRPDSGRRATSRPAAQRASIASLRERLDTARSEITRLRAENAELRQQVARHFGEQRARRDHDPPEGPVGDMSSTQTPRLRPASL